MEQKLHQNPPKKGKDKESKKDQEGGENSKKKGKSNMKEDVNEMERPKMKYDTETKLRIAKGKAIRFVKADPNSGSSHIRVVETDWFSNGQLTAGYLGFHTVGEMRAYVGSEGKCATV